MREYWKLKEEALDGTVWRTRFGRGCGHAVRQPAERMTHIIKQSACLILKNKTLIDNISYNF